MTDLIAKGRRIIETTTREAEDSLRKKLSIPAVSAADPSFVISSAPGEYPRMRTGRLVASVFSRVVIDDGLRYFMELGASAYYSKFLESGTSRMAARPHKRPTRDEYQAITIERLTAELGGR